MSEQVGTSARGAKRARIESASEDDEDFDEDLHTGFVGEPRQVYDFKNMDDLIKMYGHHLKQNATAPDLECVPRAYEESYMREPIGSERHCINEDNCQGLQISNCSGFVLKEFKLPSEEASEPANRQMCIFCRRYEVARIFYRYQALGKTIPEGTSIASYYNLVGVDGEYCIQDCIVSQNGFCGLTMPVVLHTKCAYTQHTENGVQVFRQTNLRTHGSDESVKNGAFLARRATLALTSAGVAHST